MTQLSVDQVMLPQVTCDCWLIVCSETEKKKVQYHLLVCLCVWSLLGTPKSKVNKSLSEILLQKVQVLL